MPRRILHLLANWKWTERSEPAVDLALAEQRLGAHVRFVCGLAPEEADESVALRAQIKGLDPIVTLPISKHFRFSSLIRDIPKLKVLIKNFNPHVVHFHMRNAHLMGAFASLPLPTSFRKVRSCYDPLGPKTDLRSRFLYNHCTDGLVVINKKAMAQAIRVYNLAGNNVLIAEPGVDLDRFSPLRQVKPTRRDLGLKEDAFVVGMVTRIRHSRRIDITLDAVNILADRFPRIQLLIVGRGRKGAVETVVESPAKYMGIDHKVVLPGYCAGDRLVAAYRAMDVLVYPMPGTDQTCRTVREALACGTPVLAPKIGFLPDLVEEGINGRFIQLSAESLAIVLADVIGSPERLRRMKQEAAKGARVRFSTQLQAQKVLAFYETLMADNQSH